MVYVSLTGLHCKYFGDTVITHSLLVRALSATKTLDTIIPILYFGSRVQLSYDDARLIP